jgi:uncharacterized RDD family membrane protein YckC
MPARGAAPEGYRGQGLGLPSDGPGSLASLGQRVAAFAIDALASALIAGLFVQLGHSHDPARHLPGTWSLVPLAVDYVGGILLAGRTLGMYPLGIRLIRVDADVPIGPLRALYRTALLFLLVPAIIYDRNGRGLHDRLTDTAVVRS